MNTAWYVQFYWPTEQYFFLVSSNILRISDTILKNVAECNISSPPTPFSTTTLPYGIQLDMWLLQVSNLWKKRHFATAVYGTFLISVIYSLNVLQIAVVRTVLCLSVYLSVLCAFFCRGLARTFLKFLEREHKKEHKREHKHFEVNKFLGFETVKMYKLSSLSMSLLTQSCGSLGDWAIHWKLYNLKNRLYSRQEQS